MTMSYGPCPICFADHSETARLIACQELRQIPNRELVSEAEYLARELAEELLKADEIYVSSNRDYISYLAHRAEVLRNEVFRRISLAKRGILQPLPDKGLISAEVIEQIKSQTSLLDVMRRDIEVLPKGRGRWGGKCPTHKYGQEREPSLVIYEDEGRYWCYSCIAGGDAITWLMSYHHLSFIEAVKYLAEAAGVVIEKSKPKTKKLKLTGGVKL